MMLNLNKKQTKTDIVEIYDSIVIGGGPAGLTAALYLARARMKTLVIESMIPGGQAATTVTLENYPGFPEGIGGPQLGALMEEQAKKFGAQVIYDNVNSVSFGEEIKTVITDNGKYRAKTIIIASGAKPRKLNVPGAARFDGKGISYCATCDGALFADRDIVLIGGGNSAIEEAIFLTRFVKSITIVQDMPVLTAEKILQERLEEHDMVTKTFNNKILSINGEDKIESITVEKTDTGKEETINTEGIFIYIGYIPNTDFLGKELALNDWGYIEANKDLETSAKGVYAAGDVRSKTLRQVATAVGDGALAAFNAIKYLEQ